MTVQPNIVLVHGAWADGSCWSGVIERLQADGYTVTAPQFPESSLMADVARLRQVLDRQDAPVVVAGHSYGGQIITALGTDAPNIDLPGLHRRLRAHRGRVHRRAGCPGTADPGPRAPRHRRGRLRLAPGRGLRRALRGRRRPGQGAGHDAVQQPVAAAAFQDVMGVPAWKSPPCWFMVQRATRRSRRRRSASSPPAWPRPRSRSLRATWRWSPTPTRWRSSSKPPPWRSRPEANSPPSTVAP